MRLIPLIAAFLVVSCSSPSSSPVATPLRSASPTCAQFPGNTITGTAWNAAGTGAIVSALDPSDGSLVIRAIDARSGAVTELARRPNGLANAGLAITGEVISWSELPPAIWSYDGDVRRALPLGQPLYGLHSTSDGFLGLNPDEQPGDVLQVESVGGSSVRYATGEVVDSFDSSSDGEDLVIAASNGPGTPVQFLLVHGTSLTDTLSIPGRLVTNPILRPGRLDIVYFEDHDAGVMKRVEVASGSMSIAFDEDVSEAHLTANGGLVYAFASPGHADTVCFGEVL